MKPLFLLFALLLASCARERVVEEAAQRAEQTPLGESAGARMLPIRAADGVRAFEATGRLLPAPDAHAEITLPLSATIVKLWAAPGQTVATNDVLADVVMPEAARARGQLEGARLRGEAYRARLTQLEQLGSQGLVRGVELAEARARLHESLSAEREADAVLLTVESVGLRWRGKHYQVLAPLAGIVVAVNAPLGSVRGPNDGPVVSISGGQSKRVEAKFAFAVAPHVGYELLFGNLIAPLRFVSQAPEISPNDATRLAWFDAEGPLDLPQGSTVRVRMHRAKNAWVVPVTALQPGAAAQLRTERAGLVPVEVLAVVGGEALVLADLHAEDLVAELGAPP